MKNVGEKFNNTGYLFVGSLVEIEEITIIKICKTSTVTPASITGLVVSILELSNYDWRICLREKYFVKLSKCQV